VDLARSCNSVLESDMSFNSLLIDYALAGYSDSTKLSSKKNLCYIIITIGSEI